MSGAVGRRWIRKIAVPRKTSRMAATRIPTAAAFDDFLDAI
jgi:hypothetical protein